MNRRLLSGPLIGAGVALLLVAWLGLPRTVTVVAVLITVVYLVFFVRHLLFGTNRTPSCPAATLSTASPARARMARAQGSRSTARGEFVTSTGSARRDHAA